MQTTGSSHQYGRGQAILWDVTLQMRRQLQGQRTYFFPVGAFLMGCRGRQRSRRDMRRQKDKQEEQQIRHLQVGESTVSRGNGASISISLHQQQLPSLAVSINSSLHQYQPPSASASISSSLHHHHHHQPPSAADSFSSSMCCLC